MACDRPLPDPCPGPADTMATSVRALARLVEAGLARRVGVSNVNRQQLDQAVEFAPITRSRSRSSVHDDRALRRGMAERCAELGIALIAHSPLGGPRRAGGLARLGPLLEVAGSVARLRPRSRSRGCSSSPRTSWRSRAPPPRDRPFGGARGGHRPRRTGPHGARPHLRSVPAGPRSPSALRVPRRRPTTRRWC